MTKRNKNRQYAIRLEDSLFNSIELSSKRMNIKNSVFIRLALERGLEVLK